MAQALMCEICSKITMHDEISPELFRCTECQAERRPPEKKGAAGSEKKEIQGGIMEKNKTLTEVQKTELRNRRAAGEAPKTIAADFGIESTAVWYYTKGPGKAKGAPADAGVGKKGKIGKDKKKESRGGLSHIKAAAEDTGKTSGETSESLKTSIERIVDARVELRISENFNIKTLTTLVQEIIVKLLK